MTVHFTWFHERVQVLLADTSDDTIRIYAHAYIMMLLSTQLFGDKSANRVHLRWLPFVVKLDEMDCYSSGSAALAWLYRCLCQVTNKNVTKLASPLQLLQSWIFWWFPTLRPHGFDDFTFSLAFRFCCPFQFVWETYAALDVLVVVHPEILIEEHCRLWWVVTSLIYFAMIEWHQVNRVVPHLGDVQHVPEPALNIDGLHAKNGRGGDRWFPSYFQTWHLHWINRVDSVLSIQRVADPGPSAEYLDLWHRVVHRILSPDAVFNDPKPVEILVDAFHRGFSQAPARMQVLDLGVIARNEV
ncbi:hypothetical protein Ahy_B03g066044 [Arachis hypogaea]|uniref:Aminotransferase-like plant mobile domain-containing protein n=1 Tax=Arachis hypogaea TaxID=3818 RepID=A0A445A2Z6_ARAHY|nr:hypothetical protein Ahy_B03g066044 [Arachis hypogaea]